MRNVHAHTHGKKNSGFPWDSKNLITVTCNYNNNVNNILTVFVSALVNSLNVMFMVSTYNACLQQLNSQNLASLFQQDLNWVAVTNDICYLTKSNNNWTYEVSLLKLLEPRGARVYRHVSERWVQMIADLKPLKKVPYRLKIMPNSSTTVHSATLQKSPQNKCLT